MATLTVTPRNVSASWEQGAILRNYVVASKITNAPGKGAALNSSGQVIAADADVTTTEAKAIGIIVETSSLYGELDAEAGSTVTVCEYGPVYGFSGMTPGVFGFVSKTAGELVDAAPTGGYQFAIGQAQAADVFFVSPGMASPVSA